MTLHPENRNQDRDGARQDIGRENRRDEFKPFQRGEDRDRRRDDRVAGKQRRPRDPRKKTGATPWPTADWASAIKDSVPPSPLLSARIRNKTYFA